MASDTSQQSRPAPILQSPRTTGAKLAAGTVVLAAAYSIVTGAIALIGWALDLPRLTDWNNQGISMFPNTAVCAVLSGGALLLASKQSQTFAAARVAAAAVALIAGLTLLQHLLGADFGIDTLLFDKAWGQRAAAAPMRMGPPASVSFLILGSAIAFTTIGVRWRQAAGGLGLLSIAVASLSLTGYWYGAGQLFGVASLTGIAWQTSTVLAVLGVGIVALVPEHGVVAALRRDDAGGTVLRRLIVAIIIFPFLLGWLRLRGQDAGYFDTEFGTALRTVIEIILFFTLLWWTANAISRHALTAHAAQTRLVGIVDSSEDAIIAISLEGMIESWNSGAERLFGYEAVQAIGQHISLIVPPERSGEEDALIRRLRDGERVENYESVRRRKDGRKVDVSLTISPIKSNTGQIVGASKIARDITKQKWATRRLATQDAVTRALADSATLDDAAAKILHSICEHLQWDVGGLWYVDAEAKLLRCSATWSNPSVLAADFEAVTRARTFEPGIGLPGRVWIHGAAVWVPDVTRDDNFPRAAAATKQGLRTAIGIPILQNDQVLGVIEFFNAAIRHRDEELIHMMTGLGAQIGLFIDRRQAEAALRESERRFKTLANYAPVGIFQTDRAGNCQFVNARWCEMCGMSPEEASGQGWAKALHPEDRERVFTEWTTAALTGSEFASEYRFRTPDNIVTWLSGSAVALHADDGEIVGYIGTVTDITQLKHAEQLLVAADRRKDEFLATLAHELRNPLAPIQNALEILQYENANSEAIESTRLMMQRQLSHLVRLVDDLLDVSRITQDKLELRKKRVELAPILSQAVEACSPDVERQRHEVSVHLPDEPVYLDADPVRLAQVFGNLINNACKYTPPGGRVSVEAAPQGSEVVVSVKDNGMGIAPEMLPKVFEMFAQVGRSLEQAQGGLGIGLTLVKRLVEMHGGSVEALSEGLGQGSEFCVRLPVAASEPRNNQPEPSVDAAETTVRRALVVDDNVDAAKSLAMLLKVAGIDTRTAHDGIAAIEAAQQFSPEVILLDIGMPNMNGYDVCRAMRQHTWGQAAAIIALTGWGQEEDRRKSKEAGFDAHLVKPIEHTTLLRTLSAYGAFSSSRPSTDSLQPK